MEWRESTQKVIFFFRGQMPQIQLLSVLVSASVLCSGCASNFLMNAGLQGKQDHYNVSEIKNAYRTDDQLAIHYSAKRKRIGLRRTQKFFTVYELDSKTHLPTRIINDSSTNYSSSDKIRMVNAQRYSDARWHEDASYPVLVVDVDDLSPAQEKRRSLGAMYCLYVIKDSDLNPLDNFFIKVVTCWAGTANMAVDNKDP